jgi:hypothetical protein
MSDKKLAASISANIRIGSQIIPLSSDTISDEIAAAKEKIKDRLKAGMTFNLTQPVTVTSNEFMDWLERERNFQIGSAKQYLDDVDLTLTAFRVSTKGTFAIAFRIASQEGFITGLGAEELGDIIDVTEIGLSFSYEPPRPANE